MKYYKTNNDIRAIEDGQDFLIQDDWIEISIEEVQAINQAKEDEYKTSIEYKIAEAKAYLVSTDHKFYGDYERKEGESIDYIREQRSIARAFIRANNA